MDRQAYIIIISFIIQSGISSLLIYYFLNKRSKDIKEKMIEDHENLGKRITALEKKIGKRTYEIDGIRSSFKNFQTKFLEFDTKVVKLTSLTEKD